MKNVLLIGGNGYLGKSLLENNDKYIYFHPTSNQINTNNISSNNKILKFIDENSIDIIIDFTRNNKKQLLSFLFLINQLPKKCKYVIISTYGIIYPNVYFNETEYNYSKRQVEINLRKTDLAIRTPLIIDNMQLLDKQSIQSNYIYVNSKNFFSTYLLNALNNNQTGINVMPARKIYI